MIDLKELEQKASGFEPDFKTYFKRLKKQEQKQLDKAVHLLHEEVFDEIDCLECANCCKSLGPRITDRDIERLSKALRIKPQEFIKQYLRIDEDNDYVFQSMPCPFLMPDNYCMVYENRPKACREYPHTDRAKFYQIRNITIKNSYTCPAVLEILQRLTKND